MLVMMPGAHLEPVVPLCGEEHGVEKDSPASACMQFALFAPAGRAPHDQPAAVHTSSQFCPPCPNAQLIPAPPQLESTDS